MMTTDVLNIYEARCPFYEYKDQHVGECVYVDAMVGVRSEILYLLKRRRPKLLVVHGDRLLHTAVHVGMTRGVPVFSHRYWAQPLGRGLAQRLDYARLAGMIVQSEVAAQYAVSMGVPEQRVHVVQPTRTLATSGSDSPVLGVWSRLFGERLGRDAVFALKNLRRHRPDLRVLVGYPPDSAKAASIQLTPLRRSGVESQALELGDFLSAVSAVADLTMPRERVKSAILEAAYAGMPTLVHEDVSAQYPVPIGTYSDGSLPVRLLELATEKRVAVDYAPPTVEAVVARLKTIYGVTR